MISTNYNSSFPDQVVPDEEKQTLEYGVKVGQAIEFEWFRNNRSGGDRFLSGSQFRLYLNLWISLLMVCHKDPMRLKLLHKILSL